MGKRMVIVNRWRGLRGEQSVLFPTLQLIGHEPEMSQHTLFRRSCPTRIDVTLKIEDSIVRHFLSANF
jgi:hypothetical protein